MTETARSPSANRPGSTPWESVTGGLVAFPATARTLSTTVGDVAAAASPMLIAIASAVRAHVRAAFDGDSHDTPSEAALTMATPLTPEPGDGEPRLAQRR